MNDLLNAIKLIKIFIKIRNKIIVQLIANIVQYYLQNIIFSLIANQKEVVEASIMKCCCC